MKNLSKAELIASLSKNLDLSAQQSENILNHIGGHIIETLTAYKEIALTGFGAPIMIKKRARGLNVSDPLDSVIKPADPNKRLSVVMKQKSHGHEQRKLERRNFILDIEVSNRNTGEIFGDLGDITTEGIMIVSENPIAENTVFPFRISLPKEAEEELEIVFDAKSIRCRETVHEKIFITGFTIQSLDEDNTEKIDYLIKEFAV